MVRRVLVCVGVLLLSFASARVALAADGWEIFQKLEGAWQSDGKAFNKPARITMRWTSALESKFYNLHYKIEMKDAPTARGFEGVAYYRTLGGGKHEGTWFDSGGEMHRIAASDDGSALTAYWGEPGGKYGRTIYRLLDDGKVEIIDAVQSKTGAWKEFSRNRFERAP